MSTPTTAPPPSSGSLVKRIIMGSVIAALFAGLAWADATGFAGARPGHWLVLISMVFAAGGSFEIVRMAAARGIFMRPVLVPAATAFLAAVPLASHEAACTRGASADPVGLAVAGVLGAMCVVEIMTYRRDRDTATRLAAGFATAAAVGLPFAFMMQLRLLAEPRGLTLVAEPRNLNSLIPLASMLAVVKCGDIAAYLVGSRIGRHRMAPVLSPGKTWEGAAASLTASVATAWLFVEVFNTSSSGPWGGWLLYGFSVGIAGMLGDLSESLVKRELAAKDSGASLGALGGFLDLTDAMLLAAPMAYWLWVWGGWGL